MIDSTIVYKEHIKQLFTVCTWLIIIILWLKKQAFTSTKTMHDTAHIQGGWLNSQGKKMVLYQIVTWSSVLFSKSHIIILSS